MHGEHLPAVNILLVHDTGFDDVRRSAKYCRHEARTCTEICQITTNSHDTKYNKTHKQIVLMVL